MQRATASLQQEQERTISRVSGEARRSHEALTQQLQRMVEQAARVRWWLPWKVAALLLGGTLLVNAAGAIWWSWPQAEDLQGLRHHTQRALGLTNSLATTLYPQLSKAQQHEMEAVYKDAGFAPIGPRRRSPQPRWEALTATETTRVQPDVSGLRPVAAIVLAMEVEHVPMFAAPVQDNLEDGMALCQGGVAADEELAPEERTDLAQGKTPLRETRRCRWLAQNRESATFVALSL